MNELIFYILDTETTGLSVQNHEIIEISAIRCNDKVQFSRTIRAKFPKNASLDALRITGKSFNDLYKGVSHSDTINDLEKFFETDNGTAEHRVIIAHNSPFDRKFIHAMYDKEDKIFPANLWIDSIQLVREFAKKQGIIKPRVNLEASLGMLKIATVDKLHSASGDTRATYRLWIKLIKEHNIDYLPFIKRFPHKEIEEDLTDLANEED